MASQVSKPLRRCKVCGLEAHTTQDLELFVKRKNAFYGRKPLCRECHNKRNTKNRHKNPTTDTYYRKKQELIKGFKKPVICYFCGKEMINFVGLSSDSLVIHSLDGNHYNWNPSNKVPAHHKCHVKYHCSGDKNPNRIRSLKNKNKKGD